MPLNNPPRAVYEYVPLNSALGVWNPGDLEAGTLQIRNRTTEQGTADYSTTDTTDRNPSDTRWTIDNVAVLIQLTYALQGLTTLMNYRVKVNGTSRATGTLTGTGSYLKINLSAGQFATDNNLIAVFLWADHNDGVDVTLCQPWVSVGWAGTNSNADPCVHFIPITGGGTFNFGSYLPTYGASITTSYKVRVYNKGDAAGSYLKWENGIASAGVPAGHVGVMPTDGIDFQVSPSGNDGLSALASFGISLERPS